VAKGLPAASTPVDDIMTRSPDTMTSSSTVLQALHQLQYGGYRNVPVVTESGEPLGVRYSSP
jgi:CBS domain-containing protein